MDNSFDKFSVLLIAVPTIILFIWNILQQIAISQMKKKQKRIFSGKGKLDLEKVILDCKEKSSNMSSDIDKLYEITGQIENLANKGLHKFSVVRFNPFRDIGGDQSFSVAMLNNDKNGVVISSLYSRDGVRVYAKSIKNGVCEKYQLAEEEKRAISLAIKQK